MATIRTVATMVKVAVRTTETAMIRETTTGIRSNKPTKDLENSSVVL